MLKIVDVGARHPLVVFAGVSLNQGAVLAAGARRRGLLQLLGGLLTR
ncbi:hypothetical protein [Tsukamurella paurometabola]